MPAFAGPTAYRSMACPNHRSDGRRRRHVAYPIDLRDSGSQKHVSKETFKFKNKNNDLRLHDVDEPGEGPLDEGARAALIEIREIRITPRFTVRFTS